MPSFVPISQPVLHQQPKVTVKLGTVLQKVQDKNDLLQEKFDSQSDLVVELQRDNTSKDEKLDIMQSLLDERTADLHKERQKTKQLASEIEVLKYAFHEKKISKREIERITKQVRNSGFSSKATKITTAADSAADAPDVSTWASSSIEIEIQELIQRLAKAEAQVTLQQKVCEQLEGKNKELQEQRNQHMKHTSRVLKDKERLADELQALKAAISEDQD